MALIEIGPRIEDLSGVSTRAKDSQGRVVIVWASHEVIQDYGWDEILRIAGEKYKRGDFEPGSPPRVRVTTSDLR